MLQTKIRRKKKGRFKPSLKQFKLFINLKYEIVNANKYIIKS